MSRSCIVLLLLAVLLAASMSTPSQAQPTGAVSELVELRSATSKTWLNEDGSRTAEIYSGPIHYKDSIGAWQDIDTTLVTAAKDGFSRSVEKNWFKTHLATNARGWHEVEVDGITFSFTSDSSLSPEGVSDGNSITYVDAWPDVDLKYQVTPTGIKEDIILKQKPSVNEFRFLVNPGGLKPMTVGRGIDFVDAEGKVCVRIPGPFMHDAEGELSDAVDAIWRSLPDGTMELVVQPDEEWLSQAVYPVVIDPTSYYYPTSPYGKDGYISGSTWYYDQTYLAMNVRTPKIACVQFDIEELPRNAVMSSASVSLYAIAGGGYTVYMKRNTSEWPPNAAPDTDGITLATVVWSSGSRTFSSAAVAELAQKWAWQEYDNYGVQFTCNSSADLQCCSRESMAGWPYLAVTYTQDTTDPVPGTASSDTYDNSSPITVTYSGASDTGGSGLKKVELWYKKGLSGTWTYSGQSSTTASGSFNFEGMTGDDTYYFDLVAEDHAGNRSDPDPPEGNGDDSTIYDASPPSTPEVTDDGEWTRDHGSLHASWTSVDSVSGIVEYQYAIGTTPTDPGSGYFVDWTSVGTNTSVTKDSLSLTDGITYYFYVKALNGTGLWSSVGVSDGITVTSTCDVEDEFSVSANPNGYWSYGYAANLNPSYTFVLYDTGSTDASPPTTGLERWHDSVLGTYPNTTHNPTEQEIDDGQNTVWPAETVALHPGASGKVSIVRWTAPAAGDYVVTARFWDITEGHTSTDVHVLLNGTSLFDGQITNPNDVGTSESVPSQSFTQVVTLAQNDILDFAVGWGEDNDEDTDATAVEIRISLPVDEGTVKYDHGLPTDPAKLNEAAGANRCNIRWSSADSLEGYGDDYFVLPGGTQWVVDTIRIWVVPDVPVYPSYCLGQHYQSIALYGGVVGSGLSVLSNGVFLDDSNFTSNRNISIMPVSYQGGHNYQQFNGGYNQIWQIDFNNLNLTIDGDTTYAFGVHGVPRVDRLWFNHATNSALSGWTTQGDDLIRFFDTENLGGGTSTDDGSAWFDGKGSDVNIKVFAHQL